MILVCPSCGTRYVVSPAAFAAGARQVRCARCSHVWLAEPQQEQSQLPDPLAAGLPPVIDTPQRVQPIPPGGNLPARIETINLKLVLWITLPIVMFLLLLGFGLFAIYGRATIVGWFPSLTETYASMGLRVGNLGAGLVIRGIRSEQRLEDGAMMLAIQGQVVNNAVYAQSVPIIQASAMGTEGKPVAVWEMFADPIRLIPGQVATFGSSVRYPDATVTEVTLAFVERERKQVIEEEKADNEQQKDKAGEAGSGAGSSEQHE